jgi:lysozyme
MITSAALRLATACVFGAEGFAREAFLDRLARPPVWTIGHGTTRLDGRSIMPGMTCNRVEADLWAVADMAGAARYVEDAAKVPLNDWQLAALTSFCYNIGMGHFRSSTVLEALNLGMMRAAADRLLDYDEAGGREYPGLKARRERERSLFLTGDTGVGAATQTVPPRPSADALNRAELEHLDPAAQS